MLRHIPEWRKKRLDRWFEWNLKIKSFFHLKHDNDKYFERKVKYNWDEDPKIIPYFMEKCNKTKQQTLELIDKRDQERNKRSYRLFDLITYFCGSLLYIICFAIFISVFPNLFEYAPENTEFMINTLKFNLNDMYVMGMLILLTPLAYTGMIEYRIRIDRRILSLERDILYSWLKEEEKRYDAFYD